MENLNLLLPEIFLSISIFSILLIGVFFKNSYNFVTKITYVIIIATALIILDHFDDTYKLFSGSLIYNSFTSYFKILILIGTFFVILISIYC